MKKPPGGAGLGFRREIITALDALSNPAIDFFEIAPENWMRAGGRYAQQLRRYSERFPFVCHGLSLSLGGTQPLDVELLKSIKRFMATNDVALYTEHLSWCADEGHLYDLLPLPFNEDTVKWVAGRIRQAQDILGQQIGIENASTYFVAPGGAMSEAEFIAAVVAESDCLLHLDINNIYVNARNFGLEIDRYLETLPLDKLVYLHTAGHQINPDGLIIDTHGAAVIDPVWNLLEQVCAHPRSHAATLPICLERDFDFPPLAELLDEVAMIRAIQARTHRSERLP